MPYFDAIVCALFSKTGIQILAGLGGAYLVYRLGLRAYFLQRQYEQFQNRYLAGGMDLWASQFDYALGVFRHNWALLLRLAKQYREAEEHLTTDDFFKQFIEIDQSQFQIAPNAKILALFDTNIFWVAYQMVFSFVGTSNDAIKADFGDSLNVMLQTPKHPNKTKFLDEVEVLIHSLNEKASPLYEMVSSFNELTELLAKSQYSVRDMHKFRERKDVRKILSSIKEKVPDKELERTSYR